MVRNGEKELLEKFLEETKEDKVINKAATKDGKNMLFAASEEGRLEMVDMLLDYGAKVNFRSKAGDTPIIGASYHGETKVVEMLIEKKGDVTIVGQGGNTALHVAALRGHLSTVELLHTRGGGAVIDLQSASLETPLANALKFMHFKVADYLIDKGGADINNVGANGNTPLTRSAFDGRLDTLRYCLDHGANLDHRTANGESSLLIALKSAHFKLAKLLLERGAHIDETDACGRTALMYGCMSKRQDIVAMALEEGANINLYDTWGLTPLMFISKHEVSGPILHTLLERSADPNVVDRTFSSALMHAARVGNIEACVLLMEAGADASLQDDSDQTAYMLLKDKFKNSSPFNEAMAMHALRVKSGPKRVKPLWLIDQCAYDREEEAEKERIRLAEEEADRQILLRRQAEAEALAAAQAAALEAELAAAELAARGGDKAIADDSTKGKKKKDKDKKEKEEKEAKA